MMPTTSIQNSAARAIRATLVVLALLLPGALLANELEIRVEGVSEPLLGNVRVRLEALRAGRNIRLNRRRLAELSRRAEIEASRALRPYGYYRGQAAAAAQRSGEGKWTLTVTVDAGPPLRVAKSDIGLTGPGAGLDTLQAWKAAWPLGTGRVMDQTVWEAEKQDALDLAETRGFLRAEFIEHAIEIDLEAYRATNRLVLDTGPQAVMGEVVYEQQSVRPSVLELLPRFAAGQPYDAWLLEKFRLDVWRTGYFENVELLEERRLEEDPPVVNLVVRAEARKPNTYRGSLGFGSDTGVRVQVGWGRHVLSERGDQLDIAVGWQQKFEQYSLRSNYRLPRSDRARQYWVADFLVNRQRQDINVRVSDVGGDSVRIATGNVTDYSTKGGLMIRRDFEQGYQQLFETWFGQYVYETVDYGLGNIEDGLAGADPGDVESLLGDRSALAIGVNWDWPSVRGSAFETVGHHERAWLMTANRAWGSDREFTQAYVSSSWHRLLGDRWKLLLRGELGYSDAEVRDFEIDTEIGRIPLSVSVLPSLYRFKAGGSRSVRGYGFESLSDNGLGSNHIVTASAEVELKILQNWSLAGFFDAGNAFNDWDRFELFKGAGVGVRWYSIAGAVRLDFAQALDLEGNPWRIHFTIGTPLL